MRIGLSYDLKEDIPLEQGGTSDSLEEYDSPETIDLIETALKAIGHSVVRLGGGREFLINILREKVDTVFNISEGRGTYRSREAQVPSVLEMLDIPYTGSEPQCLAVCLDKHLTKQLVAAAGVSTPRWQIMKNSWEFAETSWSFFPAIIKPAFEGSSKGVRNTSVVDSPRQATELGKRLLETYHQPVIVEEFITGDEVTTGVIGNLPPRLLGMMRILPRKRDARFVYSLEVKRDWKNMVDYECPARLEDRVLKSVEASSLRAFEVLGCRDFARVDLRVSTDGIPYFIEINPLPGLGDYSDLVIMALKLGWSYEVLIGAILDSALKRY